MKNDLLVSIKAGVVGALIYISLAFLSGFIFPEIVFGEESMGVRDWYYYFQGMVFYIIFKELIHHYHSKETDL